MKIIPMPEGTGALIARMAADDRKAASAEAMPEPQAHEARCSVATGSLPVSSAEALVRRWRAQRDDSAKAQAACAAAGDKEGEAMWDGMATALNGSANDMLRELERANKRQPEENISAQTRSGE